MHIWLDFWFFCFWLLLCSFILNYSNFLFFFFYSELLWLVLYCLAATVSIYTDELNTLGLTFFFLGLAGLEFSIGFILLILMKSFKVSLNIIQNEKNLNFFNKNFKSTFFIDNYFWIK